MKFEAAVNAIPVIHILKRIASAHVVDYTRLSAEDLRTNIVRTMKQYTHPEAVQDSLNQALYFDSDLNHRVLSELIITDILLNEYGHLLPLSELEEKLLQAEQGIVNESNEKTLQDIAGSKKDSEQYQNLALYDFVLRTAWEHQDTKSVDEANLLRKLRYKLQVSLKDHRLLESKMGKYPKEHNELHTKGEISEALRALESLGLVFEVRDNDGVDFVVIPEEIAQMMKGILSIEIRRPAFEILLQYKLVRKKKYLLDILQKADISHSRTASLVELQQRVLESLPPSILIGGTSPRDGLNNEDLAAWCADLEIPVAGTKQERICRIIEHYDKLDLRPREEGDDRELWYHYFSEFANRDRETLRAQHVIDKDLEMERYFEEATSFLFETKLNHTPLRQAGTEHSDGLLSFRDNYIMWDNKSAETSVNLKDYIKQFDGYMRNADKPVPVFLVIAPDFTPKSEVLALQYTSENIGRNIALVRACDLKELAELWSDDKNKRNTDPFPLGLFARPGVFNLESVKASLSV